MMSSRLPVSKIAILSFPLVFFGIASFSLIGSTWYLLGHPLEVIRLEHRIVPQVYGIFSATPPTYASNYESLIYGDARPILAQKYLESHHSPLASYAKLMVETADKYQIDWRLPIAIAGAESTFGKTFPEGSNNFWGYGIHERGTKAFESIEQGIETVTRYLRTTYYDQGMTTPEEIMTHYCPKSLEKGGAWAEAVNFFIQELENY